MSTISEVDIKDWPQKAKGFGEVDPNGKSAKEPGSKLDANKPAGFRGLISYFPRACLAVANVSTVGAIKYTWAGWETVPDGVNRYMDAMIRHSIAPAIEGPIDKDTGLYHLSQAAWNSLAALELFLREQE